MQAQVHAKPRRPRTTGRGEIIPFPAPVRSRIVFRRLVNKMCQVVTFILADAVALAIAFILAYIIRRDLLPVLIPGCRAAAISLQDYAHLSWLALIYLVFYTKEGLYVRRRPFWVEVRHLYTAIFFATGFFLAALTVTHLTTHVSRAAIGLMTTLLLVWAPLTRYLIKSLLFYFGAWRKRILIIGATPTGQLLAHNLERDPFLGYEVAGFLDDDRPIGTSFAGHQIMGGINQLPVVLEETGSSDVILALSATSPDQLQSVVSLCERCTESVRLVPDVLGFGLAGAEIEMVSQVPIISMNYNLRKPWNVILKTAFDRSLALLVFILVLPLLALCALLVVLESGRPFLFSQRRVAPGYGFQFFKFRTMYVDADKRLKSFLASHPDKQEEWNTYRKLRGHDPRVTRIGAFLRKTSIDELPQLWHVICGEMSMVGPRPYMPDELQRMGPDPDRVLQTILIARPGLTGLWQVSGRNEVPFETRIRMDFHYVRNWSIWLDLVILWKTIWVVLARKGAY